MLRIFLGVVFALGLVTEVRAEGEYTIFDDRVPVGSEEENTTADPGWWQRTFVGWDQNGDGQYRDGERGILLIAYDAIAGFFGSIGKWLVDSLLAVLPDDWRKPLTDLIPYIRIANSWVPLDYCFTLYAIYQTFLVAFISVKFVLKMIPGIG